MADQLSDAAPWEARFRVERVVWTKMARRNPTRGLAVSNRSGVFQLHAWDVPSGRLTQLTDRPEGVTGGDLSPDGRHVYYLDDDGGNEIGHLVRVAWEGSDPESLTPDLPPYSTFGGAISDDGSLLGLTTADGDGFALVLVDLAPDGSFDAPRRLYQTTSFFLPPVLSPNGRLAAVASTEQSTVQHYRLLVFDTRGGERLAELWEGDGTSVHPVAFAPDDGQRLAGTTNRSGFTRPVVWRPTTGERHELLVDDLDGDVTPIDWSPDGQFLLLMQTSRATQRLWTYDLELDALIALDHPAGCYGFWGESGIYYAPSGEIVAQWQAGDHPSSVIALDAETGRQTAVLLAAGEVPPSRPLRSVSFPSSDSQVIQGWLGVPEGDGPFPTILMTHGGPEAVELDAYQPGAQSWLDHGYAYLSVNYRGSTTFGRDFQQQIWGNLGQWELEDMVAARAWLIDNGVAHPDQVLLTGWSYGGFLTLLGLGKRPELWAGGMAGIAIADWAGLYEDSSEALKGYCTAMFGGTPEDKWEQYRISSPATYLEDVTAPVQIIHGRNDTRTPARQIARYAERLAELGKTVELHWFDSGHAGAGADREQAIAHQRLMLVFADGVLGR